MVWKENLAPSIGTKGYLDGNENMPEEAEMKVRSLQNETRSLNKSNDKLRRRYRGQNTAVGTSVGNLMKALIGVFANNCVYN